MSKAKVGLQFEVSESKSEIRSYTEHKAINWSRSDQICRQIRGL